jgi:hypothetical protein
LSAVKHLIVGTSEDRAEIVADRPRAGFRHVGSIDAVSSLGWRGGCRSRSDRQLSEALARVCGFASTPQVRNRVIRVRGRRDGGTSEELRPAPPSCAGRTPPRRSESLAACAQAAAGGGGGAQRRVASRLGSRPAVCTPAAAGPGPRANRLTSQPGSARSSDRAHRNGAAPSTRSCSKPPNFRVLLARFQLAGRGPRLRRRKNRSATYRQTLAGDIGR